MISLDELCEQYYEQVYKRAKFLVHDHEAAQEVTQEVFMRVTKGYHTLKHDTSIYAWLYRITTNTVYDLHKRTQSRLHPLSMEALTYPDSGKPMNEHWHPMSAQDAVHERVVMADDLRDFCETLTPKQRMCFQAQLLGFTYQEIADASGLTFNAIREHLVRVRKKRERARREQRAS